MAHPASPTHTEPESTTAAGQMAAEMARTLPRKKPLAPFQLAVADELSLVDDILIELLSSSAGLIGQVAAHVMIGVGKKFRPTLLLLAAQAAGPAPSGDEARARRARAAAVVELVHTATLIHDDSLDKSLLRRGIPTVNHLWNDDVSIIMGDYMYSKAFSTLVHHNLWDAMQILADTTNEMSIGEMQQIENRRNVLVTEADYEAMITNKTASLVQASCEIGALLGGGAARETMRRYGLAMGRAFQITDDLIDYLSASEETGKPAGTDLREGKITLPLIAALARAPRERADDVRALIQGGGDITDAVWHDVLVFIEDNGGIEVARARAAACAADARGALASLPASPAREALSDALDYVMARRT